MGKLTEAERREIEDRIKALDMQQYAIKIIINAIYGAFGNKYFYFYDPEIAQTITVQGQDLIKFSISAINHYIMNRWHLDTELHKELGLEGCEIGKVETTAAIYADTDSTYSDWGELIAGIKGKEFTEEEKILLVKAILDKGMSVFLGKAFQQYAAKYNTTNRMKFKLESISSVGIWVAKKHYVLRVNYDSGFFLNPPKLMAKGIELAQPSFPAYARDRQREIINVMLDRKKKLVHEKDIIPMMVSMRKAFDHMDLAEICYNYNVAVYDKYVLNDKALTIPKGMPIRTRAALYHNNMIEQTGNLKYQKIREGDKVKFYYAKHPNDAEMNVFAYMPGNLPEFAFPLDYDEQFFSLVVDPINKLLDAMSMQSITPELRRYVKFNMPKTKRIMKPEEIYPLYIINNTTLEYVEFPRNLDAYFMRPDMPVPDDVFDEYFKYTSMYGAKTEVVPKFELQKYIKKRQGLMAKASARAKIKQLSEETKEMFDEAVMTLKGMKVKYTIDDATFNPTFTSSKTKKVIAIPVETIEEFPSAEEIVGYVRGSILVEQEVEAEEKNENV